MTCHMKGWNLVIVASPDLRWSVLRWCLTSCCVDGLSFTSARRAVICGNKPARLGGLRSVKRGHTAGAAVGAERAAPEEAAQVVGAVSSFCGAVADIPGGCSWRSQCCATARESPKPHQESSSVSRVSDSGTTSRSSTAAAAAASTAAAAAAAARPYSTSPWHGPGTFIKCDAEHNHSKVVRTPASSTRFAITDKHPTSLQTDTTCLLAV